MVAVTAPRSVGEIETFITMLRTACSDKRVYERLERLLSLSDGKRRAVVHAWVSDLMIAGAPTGFVQAIACLADDAVAEKAYEVIYRCQAGDAAERAGARRFQGWMPDAVAARARLRKLKPWLLGGATALALTLVAGMVWVCWPGPRFVEAKPLDTVRPRSPEIAAYEAEWWQATRTTFTEFCADLSDDSTGAYWFMLYVNSAGRVIDTRVANSASDPLAFRVKREVASLRLPAFTQEQKAQARGLWLRGHLSIVNGRCVLTRT